MRQWQKSLQPFLIGLAQIITGDHIIHPKWVPAHGLLEYPATHVVLTRSMRGSSTVSRHIARVGVEVSHEVNTRRTGGSSLL